MSAKDYFQVALPSLGQSNKFEIFSAELKSQWIFNHDDLDVFQDEVALKPLNFLA